MVLIELASRRLDFDPEALVKVAAEVSGASKCTEIEVLAEGLSFSFFLKKI